MHALSTILLRNAEAGTDSLDKGRGHPGRARNTSHRQSESAQKPTPTQSKAKLDLPMNYPRWERRYVLLKERAADG
jgi:hypothetical protein